VRIPLSTLCNYDINYLLACAYIPSTVRGEFPSALFLVAGNHSGQVIIATAATDVRSQSSAAQQPTADWTIVAELSGGHSATVRSFDWPASLPMNTSRPDLMLTAGEDANICVWSPTALLSSSGTAVNISKQDDMLVG